MNPELSNLIRSAKSMKVAIQGYPLAIEIFRLSSDALWTLEIVDHTGARHKWGMRFASTREARDTAIHAIETKGPTAFLRVGNENAAPSECT